MCTVNTLPGAIGEITVGVAKDEIALKSTHIDMTSCSAALVRPSYLSREKDIRMFLDGTYVSSPT